MEPRARIIPGSGLAGSEAPGQRSRTQTFLLPPMRRLHPLAAVADQAWLSLLNLVISLAFIWSASKVEYGYYLLLVAPLLLVQSIQNAVVNSPLATFLPAAAEQEKRPLRRNAATLHVYIAIVGAALGALGLALYERGSGHTIDNMLVAGFAFAVVGTIAREAQRSFAYVQGQGVQALLGDLVYGAALLAGIAWAIQGHQLTAAVVLFLTGFAGVLPLLAKLRQFQGLELQREPVRQFWSCGRWALPSVVVTWINLSAYPYFAGQALGLATVADIGAARLFLMPVGIAMTAWSNWYRPRISALLASGNSQGVIRITHHSVTGGLGAMAVLAVLILWAYPMLEPALGEQYAGLQPLVLMWLVFFTLSLVRNMYMATLMTDAHGYKILHHITWLALALSLPGFLLFSANGALWVVGILCAVELTQLLLVVAKAHGYWKEAASGR